MGGTTTLILTVTLPAGWVQGTAALVVPDGFRWRNYTQYLPAGYQGSPPALYGSHEIRIYGAAGTGPWRYTWSWPTRDQWPTTLPGSAI